MSGCDHTNCQQSAIERAENLCAELGTHFTGQRRRIYEIIWEGHQALTAREIMEKLGNKQPPITYRALEFLTKIGLVHHITSLNAYVGCTHGGKCKHENQLFICTTCKYVQEIPSSTVTDGILESANKHNFKPETIHLEVLGTCQNCL